jgi:hypothetical protein
MSLDLKDFRGKITVETDAALEAMNCVTGKEKSEIVREILHKWATDKINEARLLDSALVGQGLSGIGRAPQGSAGKSR